MGGGGCGRQDPKPSSPRGCSAREAPRVAGQALAHRSGWPTLSSVQGLRAGAGGGEEGGEQRPRQGGVHPAGARGRGGPSWAAPPLRGGEPPAGHQGSSGARGSLRDAGSPLGCGWMSLPNLGVSRGRGSVSWKWGTRWSGGGAPHTRARSPVRLARGSESARGSRARRSPELRRGPGRAGLLGRYWGPGVRGPGLCWGPGVRKVPGVRRAPGARSGTSAAASAAGAGGLVCAPSCPRAGLRGAADGRAAAARAPPCCSAAGREGERRAGERRGAGPGGGLGPPGRGEGRTRRGTRGAGGRAGPGRAAGSPGVLRAPARRGGV